MKIFSIGILFCVLCGCNNDNLPKYVELKGLRVLGLIATPPEIDPGGVTTVTPVVSDISETTSLNFEAFGCIPATPFDTSCSGNPTSTSLASGTLNSGDMVASRGFTGVAATFQVTAPASNLIFAQRRSQDQFNGVPYLVVYEVRNSAGDRVQSFKRILISSRPSAEKNQNPAVTEIRGNGSALTTTLPAGQKLDVAPVFGTPASETYRVQTETGGFRTETEELVTTWFVTDGTLKYYRSVGTDPNLYEAPGALPTGRDSFLLSLTRDDRGGLAFKKNCFGTCP